MTTKRKFTDDYLLGEVIGSGSFSTVCLGKCKKTGDSFAIKIIERQKLTQDDLSSILSEIQLLSTIDHPNVLKLYDHYLEGDKVYMVTEYCAGGELYLRIKDKEYYPEPDAQKVLKDIAKALQYCHEKKIVHRDLKPENILFLSKEEDSPLKLADFGFAKEISDAQLQTALGTVSYIAPEILNRQPYGTSVDLWSFGVIAYILLAGYPPFYSDSPTDLFQKIKECRYQFDEPYWNEVSKEAQDLISRLLVVDPASRLTIKDVLEHPWMTNVYKEVTPGVNELRNIQARRALRREYDDAMSLTKLRQAVQNPNAA